MSDLDKYFRPPSEENDHPKLRFWKELMNRPEVGKVLFELRRERDGLTFRPAKMYIHLLYQDGNEPQCDSEDWDDDLNRTLTEMEIPAISADNEKKRFGLMLKGLLEKPGIMFGNAVFNTVLLDMLRNSGFGAMREVREKLERIHRSHPDKCVHCRFFKLT
ncbi:MAG: hypothetical protein DRI57_01865 [Deltaproteobacteria bacterium]|nr:MAG: hypothetical protein DRI57_01865 [Deltaproteobacteria bacterium]